jgi:hypothetical protein
MAMFLSPEWVSAFNDAVRDVTVPAPGSDAGLVAQDGAYAWCQVVTGGPDGEKRVTLRVAGGHLSMQSGEAADVNVTIRIEWAAAAAMARGELSPAEAIATGQVRVRGDLAVLGAGQALVAALGPQLAALHETTTY